MPTDLTIVDADRDQIRQYLDALRQAGDDFEQFVNEQLRELDSLRVGLDERMQQLDREREELRGQFDRLRESQQRLDQASAAAERWISTRQDEPSAAPADNGELAAIVTEMRSERSRFSEEFASAQLQSQALVQSSAAELVQARAELLAATEQLQQERLRWAETAAPLVAAATNYAAAQTQAPAVTPLATADSPESSIAEPIATTDMPPQGTQQNWWRELQRRRGQTKTGTQPRAQSSAEGVRDAKSATASGTTSSPAPSAGDDAAINSILQQFEILQRDLTGHRSPPSAKVPK